MFDQIMWTAVGVGATYAMASFIAMAYFATEHFKTWRLVHWKNARPELHYPRM